MRHKNMLFDSSSGIQRWDPQLEFVSFFIMIRRVVQSFSLELTQTKEVSFIFTPASDLGTGEYTLMLGAQNDAITIMKAIKVHILD